MIESDRPVLYVVLGKFYRAQTVLCTWTGVIIKKPVSARVYCPCVTGMKLRPAIPQSFNRLFALRSDTLPLVNDADVGTSRKLLTRCVPARVYILDSCPRRARRSHQRQSLVGVLHRSHVKTFAMRAPVRTRTPRHKVQSTRMGLTS